MKCIPLKLDESYIQCNPDEATHIYLNLPGPLTNRIIPVIIKGKREGTRCWSWNGETESVTIKPSVRTSGEDENGKHVCHSFINDGKVIFLDDCSHELKGQTLDLLDVEW